MPKVIFALILITLAVTPLYEAPKNIAIGLLLVAMLWWRPRPFPEPLRWLGYLVVVALVSAFGAFSPLEGFRGTVDYLRIFILGLAVSAVVRDERWADLVLAVIVSAVTAGALWSMARLELGYGLESYHRSGLSILSLGFSNHTATYLVLSLAAAFALINARPLGYRLLGGGTAMVLFFALVRTSSRGAWVATICLAVFYLLRCCPKKPVFWVAIVAIIVVVILTFAHTRYFEILAVYNEIFEPELYVKANTLGPISWRLQLWRGCGEAMMDNPLLGVGPKNFSNLDPEKYLRPWQYTDHAHNFLVNIAVEVGLAGLAVFIAFFLHILRSTFSGHDRFRILAQGALIALAVAGMATTTFHTEGGLLFITLIGIHLGMRDTINNSKLKIEN